MIHTDHRCAPIAMTNEDREVVWRGQFNVWGQSTAEHSTQPAHQAAELNLRLPGQYFDAETGLHDNRWRTYNPANGHYLQPDPMPNRVGYAQGFNPYLYVGGDPLNRIDPLGLYDVDTHYYTTFFLALVAGVNYEDAKTIATAAQYIDDNPETKPFPSLSMAESWQYERLSKYHFTMWGHQEATVGATTKTYNDSTDLRNYDEVWRAQLNRLEGASNASGISRCAQLQFFGEFLHAFEDSYGHRDQNNVPITINAGLGHAVYGHEPDKTYNGSYLGAYVAAIGDWDTREQRTLTMQEDAFNKMAKFSSNGPLVSWDQLKVFMMDWNKIKEEGNKSKDKREGFNSFLTALDIRNSKGEKVTVDILLRPGQLEDAPDMAPDGYKAPDGATRRLKNLCGLKQEDFPGTILPTQATGCPK